MTNEYDVSDMSDNEVIGEPEESKDEHKV